MNDIIIKYDIRNLPYIVICGIYKITSPAGKVYIGQSKTIFKRWIIYRNLCSPKQIKLFNSLKKYGVDNHTFEIIHTCDKSELNEWECYYSDLYNVHTENGLNLGPVGDRKGISEETRIRMSKSQEGRTHSEETKNKQSDSNKDKPKSEEHIKKLKDIWDKKKEEGKVLFTEEHRKNLSESKMGHPVNPKSLEAFKKNWVKKPRKPKIYKTVIERSGINRLNSIKNKSRIEKEKYIFKKMSKEQQFAIINVLSITNMFNRFKRVPRQLVKIYNSN